MKAELKTLLNEPRTMKELCNALGYSRFSISRWLKELEDEGYTVQTSRRRPQTYQLKRGKK